MCFGVLGLFLERKVASVRLGRLMTAVAVPKILKLFLLFAGSVLTYLDRKPVSINKESTLFTTGYFFTGIKR